MKKFVIFLILTGLFQSGCHDEESLETWLREIGSLKHQVERVADSADLSWENHLLIKRYFSEVSNTAISLKTDVEYSKDLRELIWKNKALKRNCLRALLDRNRWTTLMLKCTRGQFFICAEEVRFYPEALEIIESHLF